MTSPFEWLGHDIGTVAQGFGFFAWLLLSRPLANDEAGLARFKMRKEQSGIVHRDDIKTFVDYIDADEKRL